MTESKLGEGWTLHGNESLRCLQRQAAAVLRTIELLDTLHGDTLWSDSCTIAECIQEIANALGWRHEGLVGYMLLGDEFEEMPVDGWPHERIISILRMLVEGITDHPAAELAGDVPEHGVHIALHTLKGGLSDESALCVLREVIGIAANFIGKTDYTEQRLHPRIRATMDAIWEAASWVGNGDLETVEGDAVAA